MKKNVLITGVTGFLGQSLVSALHNDPGVTLFGHSRDVTRATAALKEFDIQLIPEIDARVFEQLSVHTIIHLAGIAHDLSNRYTTDDYFEVNDLATRRLYDEFLKASCTSFIYLSSIKAAVDAASRPVVENIAPSPVSAYGKSKLNAERYIQQTTTPADKKYFILRPSMIHGPGNKGNLNLLFKYVKTGLPFPLGQFQNQRSFLSIDNFTFAIRQLLDVQPSSGIYHLADDGALSTTELFRIIAKASGKPGIVFNIPRRLVRRTFSLLGKSRMLDKLTEDMIVSNEKIKEALGKSLPVTIDEGLRKTIRSFNGK